MQELLAVCALVGMEFNEKDPLLINLTSSVFSTAVADIF
jgi:hypothetical protein